VVNLLRGLWIGEAWSKHLLDVGVLAGMLILGIIILGDNLPLGIKSVILIKA